MEGVDGGYVYRVWQCRDSGLIRLKIVVPCGQNLGSTKSNLRQQRPGPGLGRHQLAGEPLFSARWRAVKPLFSNAIGAVRA